VYGVQDDHSGGGVFAVPAASAGQLLCTYRRPMGGERFPVLRRVRGTLRYVTRGQYIAFLERPLRVSLSVRLSVCLCECLAPCVSAAAFAADERTSLAGHVVSSHVV